MTDIKFADNFADLCRESGVDAGFQFEFYCERCGDTWRTPFVAYRSGQASGWIGKLSGALGGVLGGAAETVSGLSQAGWHNSRDQAFKSAIEQAKGHFHRCARCFQYVCDTCWTSDRGLCLNCAPDLDAEIESARAHGEISAAVEKAITEGQKRGKKADVARSRQLVCPECGAQTNGGKFCPECGYKLTPETRCPGCNAEVPLSARFCPECGGKLGGRN